MFIRLSGPFIVKLKDKYVGLGQGDNGDAAKINALFMNQYIDGPLEFIYTTPDENEEEKLNELLHFLSAKKYSEMPDKQNRVLDYGALKINAEYRSVESNGELVQLTNYEFEILYLLAKNPGRIFSKEQIYTQVWKEPYYGAEDNVMGIIRRIRKKIEPDSAKPRYILNVWGMGYKFNGELMK